MQKDRDTKKVAFTTSINHELLKKFRVYCAINGLYQNQVIEKLISDLLEEVEEESQKYD